MATVFNKLWIDALLNKTDPSKRFYPLANSGGLRNFKTERADPIMQSWDAGGKSFIRDESRTVEFFVMGIAGATRNNGIINGFRCKPYGVYIIDRQQNFIGILSTTTGNCDTCNCNSAYKNTGLACSPQMTDPYNLIFVPLYADDGTQNGILLDSGAYLYPIPVDQESIYAKLMFNDAKSTVQGNMVRFDFVQTFKDSTLNMIPCSSFTDWQPSMIRGLIDVCPVLYTIENTFSIIDFATSDGDAVSSTLATGWVAADLTLFNVTDNLAVTITSVTEDESMPGRYTINYASQTNGDIMRLSATKTGFDTTCFESTTFAIGES